MGLRVEASAPEVSAPTELGGSDIDGIFASLGEVKDAPEIEKKEIKDGKTEVKEKKNVLGKDLAPGSIEAEIAAMMEENGEVDESEPVEDLDLEEATDEKEEVVEEKTGDDLEEITYNGKVEKITKEQMKELAQKGKDYTQKTQNLAEEKAKFVADKKAAELEINEYFNKVEAQANQSSEKLAMLEKWDIAVDMMKEQNPDLFAEVSTYFNNSSRQYDNPVVTRKFAEQQKEIELLKGQLSEKKNSDIRTSFESDLSKTRNELGSKLESLGVFVDWDGQVKDAWINSGVDTVKSAVYAIYGDQIRAANESRTKSLEAQLKAKSKNTIAGASGKRSTNTGEASLQKQSWGHLTKMALASIKNN